MNQSVNFNVLNVIAKVFEQAKGSKLHKSFFTKNDKELSLLAGYFGTNKPQALFVSVILGLYYQNNSDVDMNDLINLFDCNPIKILEYNKDFEELLDRNIIEKKYFRNRFGITKGDYVVNEKVFDAIVNNDALPELKNEKRKDLIEVLSSLYLLLEERDEENISTHTFFVKVKTVISENLHFPLIKKINGYGYDPLNTFTLLYLIWKKLEGKDTVDLSDYLEKIYENVATRIRFVQEMLKGNNALIKDNWIEIVESHFLNDAEMKLTDEALSRIEETGLKIQVKKLKKRENVWLPEEIPPRKLFFNEKEMQQLFLLKDMLKERKFRAVQKRLADKNLPGGITALLHGAPGTGKTEIVKQIARETGRPLMKVDISKTKSKWFGESEKIIKKVFTDYRKFAGESKRTPILFFNEADAIFSKRKDINSSNVAQTENAIQNIILDELENFDGILIATTNLAVNMDKAFERRFLFKIPFNKPGKSIRTKIWKSKLPSLKIKECRLLAEKFDLTGGQIDNIVRKKEIQEIIQGQKIKLHELIRFCEEESLQNPKERGKIGF